MKRSVDVLFALMGILFCVCLIIANILEVKIISIGSLTLTGGIIVFPISYIINDCVVEVWGYRKARLLIWTGFAANFIAVLFIQLAVWLPAASVWSQQEAFASLFGLTPRIVLASFIAFLIGSFINASVMSRMKLISAGAHFSLRAIVSTVFGEGGDSLLFFPLAFGGILPIKTIGMLILSQTLLKSAYEVVILPITIRVVRWVKQHSGTDEYDKDVSYNIFKIKNL
ncbi:MAG: queuosine precursor transporter [Porphyromonadaceae bacterium]|nr:queuosine precursor transporter [Porphyromonadaceae bacterium]